MGLFTVFSRLPIIHLVYKNRFNFPSLSHSFVLSLVLYHSQNIRFVIHSFRLFSHLVSKVFGIWFSTIFSVVSFSKCLVSHTPTFCWFCRFVCLFFGLREFGIRSIPKPIFIYFFVLTQKVFWFCSAIKCSVSSFKKSR